MSYQDFSNVSWERVLNTTIPKYIREEVPAMARNFQMYALLESRGRIVMNEAGNGFTWPVRFRYHDTEGNTGRTVRNFQQINLWDTANLPWRGYQVTDALYEIDLQMNQGEQAIVKVIEGFEKRLADSLMHGLGKQFYIDGNASGNEEFWHGVESMFGATQTIKIDDGTARTANAADRVMYPNDTYASLSTELGSTHGGSSNAPSGSSWPEGIADSQYDYWSPVIVAWDSSDFSGASQTFAAQGDEAIRYAKISSNRNRYGNKSMSNFFLARNLWTDFLNLLDDKERVIVDKGSTANSLKSFGFTDVVGFDGMEVSMEVGIDGGVGYGFNPECITLRCLRDEMFKTDGPVYDEYTQAYNCAVSTNSNLQFDTPRNFAKLIQAT